MVNKLKLLYRLLYRVLQNKHPFTFRARLINFHNLPFGSDIWDIIGYVATKFHHLIPICLIRIKFWSWRSYLHSKRTVKEIDLKWSLGASTYSVIKSELILMRMSLSPFWKWERCENHAKGLVLLNLRYYWNPGPLFASNSQNDDVKFSV